MAWHPADADTSAFVAQCPEEIHDLANERVVNRHFQNGETTCCQLSKRLPNNSTIFAADPPKCCYFVAVGGLVCMDDPRGYASWSSWLLEGSTMLDRLFERGQTKCNTPLGTPMIPEAMSWSQCGFRKHRSTTDHLVSLERYLRDAFAQRQQAVGLFFDLEKAYETTWQYGIIRDLHRIGLRGRLPVFVSEYLRDRRIRVRIGTTLSDVFYPEEGVPTGGVLDVTCFGLKINGLPSCIARDIFKALFVDDLAICFRGRSLDTIER